MTTLSDARVSRAITAALAGNYESPASAAESQVNGRASFDGDPWSYTDQGFPLGREQGELLYLLVRAIGAKRVVEFATSFGVSTLHLAAAVRDNGGGVVIGAELIPEKIKRAHANLEAAGLDDLVEIREGDATRTLRDVGGQVDLVLIDGWPDLQHPSLDRRVLEVLAPQLRVGGIVFDDNGEDDVREFLAEHHYHVATLPNSHRRGTGVVAIKLVG
jgi:predicted O-methyltransferase YrrM